MPPILLIKFITLTFFGFFDLGLPLGTLAPDVLGLGFGPGMVLAVIALQSLVTIISRHRAGALCDRVGARRTTFTGLIAAILAALLYLLVELQPVASPPLMITLLLIARIALGLAESMVLVGSLTWALTALGPSLSWQVLALQGAAMHLGLLLGAVAGIRIEASLGLMAVPLLALIIPIAALVLAQGLEREYRPASETRIAAHDILHRIWRPGLVLALATIPLTGMLVLLLPSVAPDFWHRPGATLVALVLGYVLARLAARQWRDRWDGAQVLVLSLGIEACGQALLLTGSAMAQLAGAFLTGLGYSLVFPILGMAVLRRFAEVVHGRAIGGYSAFQDLAIGIFLPVAAVGFGWQGQGAVFTIGLIAAGIAATFALSKARRDLVADRNGGLS